ncbi:hypothetical protein ANCDUO_01090 [Ancylostoma duodenale]|uniref:Uncharacterized protein n=1 Tax=Ancylostoma duodenale TaxID=51022 RepID=A0A0C2HA90_9BILA|nr:hypothetical protein ANCDUO_01090 [Ancylostoma duodenale]
MQDLKQSQKRLDQALQRNGQQQISGLIQSNLNRSDPPHQRNCQAVTIVQANQNCAYLHDLTANLAATPNRHIIQTASALIFNEEEQDYQPVTRGRTAGDVQIQPSADYSEGHSQLEEVAAFTNSYERS